jgi:hypothetical protein
MLEVMEWVLPEIVLLLDHNQKFEEHLPLDLERLHEIAHLKQYPRVPQLLQVLFHIDDVECPVLKPVYITWLHHEQIQFFSINK